MDPMSKMLGKLSLMVEQKQRAVTVEDDDIDEVVRDFPNVVMCKILLS